MNENKEENSKCFICNNHGGFYEHKGINYVECYYKETPVRRKIKYNKCKDFK